MTSRLLLLSIFTGVFFHFALARAEANSSSFETDQEILRTFVNFYIQTGQYEKVQEKIKLHLENYPKDAGAWNTLGLSYFRTGQNEKAAKAFYRAIQCAENKNLKGIYIYQYADAVARSGNVEKSKKALKKAEQYEDVAASAMDAQDQVQARRPLPPLQLRPGARINAALSLTAGYDSNVLLVADGSLSTVERSDRASPYISPLLYLFFSKGTRKGIWNASMMGTFTYYSQEAVQTFNLLYYALDTSWETRLLRSQGFSSRFGNKFDYTMTNPDGLDFFLWTDQLYWEGTWRQSLISQTEFAVAGRYQDYKTETTTAAEDVRTGLGGRVAVTQVFQHEKNEFRLGGEFDQQQAQGFNFKTRTLTGSFGYARALTAVLRFIAGFSYSSVDYFESDDKRSDTVVKVSGAFSRNFTPQITGGLDYSFRKNGSNVESAIYGKHLVRLTFTYALF